MDMEEMRMSHKPLKLLTAALSAAVMISAVPVSAKSVEDFTDVPANAWFYDSVADVSQKELMTGLDGTTFGPAETLGRAQFATILYRMAGSPAVTYTPVFPDVPDGQFYSVPVTWASTLGIVTGYEDSGFFGTSDAINREQLATMLYRYAEKMGLDTSARGDYTVFPDGNQVNGFAEEAMKWAVGKAILTGNGDGTLAPQDAVNRAVCAAMISRFTGSSAEDPSPSVPQEPQEPQEPTEREQALTQAQAYLSYEPLSYTVLVKTLQLDGYSADAATYAADNCGADWDEQASRAIVDALEVRHYSCDGVTARLNAMGFTADQTARAVNTCGVDWDAQAARAAAYYLEHAPHSYRSLTTMLKYDGFTSEQITRAVDNCGADWNAQATKFIKAQLAKENDSVPTREELYRSASYNGFTDEQINYGLAQAGY